MAKCQKQLIMKAFLLEHETTLLPVSYGVGQANVSYPFTRFSYLIVAGVLVGHNAAGFPCSAPLLFLGLPHLSHVLSCQHYAVLTQQILLRSAR